MISLKIDVTQIDKSKLHKSEKTGAIYLDAVLFETPKSEYNDFIVVQSLSKEERDAGKKGAKLGNASNYKPETDDETAPLKDADNAEVPF